MAMEEVLEKIEEQLQCSVCLETFTNPKQLLCHHTCCLKCLKPLVKSQQSQLSVTCPLCRHVTPVPPGGVDSLQSAVHVPGLLEIRDLITKLPVTKEAVATSNHELESIQASIDRQEEICKSVEESILLELANNPDFSYKLEHSPFLARFMESPVVVYIKMHDHCKSKTTCGIAVGSSGIIVASDEAKHCIITSYPSHELCSFGTHGSGLGQLNSPRGVAVDSEGNILVADCNNHRIQKFTAQGQFLKVVGSKGKGHLQFKVPKDVAVSPITRKVYVVDANHRVQILNSDLSFFKKFGKYGYGRGQFHDPHGIACDSTGKVYVADTGNHRIQVFTSEGDSLWMFGRHGESIGQLDYPYSLVIDEGLVYVSEYNNNRVSLFTCDGRYEARIGGENFEFNLSTTDNLFTKPRGLAFGGNGVLYMCDQKSIQAFTGMMCISRTPKIRDSKYKVAVNTIKKWIKEQKFVIAGFLFGFILCALCTWLISHL